MAATVMLCEGRMRLSGRQRMSLAQDARRRAESEFEALMRKVEKRDYDRAHRRSRHLDARDRVPAPPEVPADMFADAQRRMAYVGTPTEQICGDPRPGQSALDKKRKAFEKVFLP